MVEQHGCMASGERENDRRLLEGAGLSVGLTRGLNPNARDADDVDADSSGDESSSDDDSDAEMADLQAELEKIKCVYSCFHDAV